MLRKRKLVTVVVFALKKSNTENRFSSRYHPRQKRPPLSLGPPDLGRGSFKTQNATGALNKISYSSVSSLVRIVVRHNVCTAIHKSYAT